MKVRVQVKPKSKKENIEINDDGLLVVKVNALPVEGEANKKVIEVLAKHYGVPKSNIKLLKGQKSKIKVFEISN